MSFHIVLPRRMNLAKIAAEAARGEAPRHAMGVLAEELLWTLARRVASQTGPGDSIFCSSEAGGFQLAAVLGGVSKRPRLVVFVHNVDRPKARFALKAWRLANKVDVFMACSQSQVEFLRDYLKLPDDRVRHVWDHTDTQFFTPGAQSPAKKRPLVVSVGLEQRDYKTLAAATRDLDLDVRISGFSKDASAMARTFPEPLPANMSRRFYTWPDLVQLYRDADVVVVSCHENKYAAGVQSLMEATACGRPVIATATEGLRAYVRGAVVPVKPGDVHAMRAAVIAAVRDPEMSQVPDRYREAARCYELSRYVSEITGALKTTA
jgi:glycosyltransferase involved in cell wall biosynthesis